MNLKSLTNERPTHGALVDRLGAFCTRTQVTTRQENAFTLCAGKKEKKKVTQFCKLKY